MQGNFHLNRKIVLELYRSLVLLGAESDLLGTVGSWGDTLPDEDVLAGLQQWNADTLNTLRGRIEHFEISSHPSEHSRVLVGQSAD